MKKLICVDDVKKCIKEGQKSIPVDSNTIITPSAKDFAAEKGVAFTESTCDCGQTGTTCSDISEGIKQTVAQLKENDFDRNLIERIVRQVLAERGGFVAPPFESERDASGLKLIRGKTVKCEKFDKGNPDSNVALMDIVTTRESPNMGAGFMTIKESDFDWTLHYDEMEYITDGELTVTVGGKTYQGKAGDVFYIPKNTKIRWSTPSNARFFYVTYPADWAAN